MSQCCFGFTPDPTCDNCDGTGTDFDGHHCNNCAGAAIRRGEVNGWVGLDEYAGGELVATKDWRLIATESVLRAAVSALRQAEEMQTDMILEILADSLSNLFGMESPLGSGSQGVGVALTQHPLEELDITALAEFVVGCLGPDLRTRLKPH